MLIDACVHHRWADQDELLPYLSRGWREYLEQPKSFAPNGRTMPLLPRFPYRRADGDRLASAEDAAAGASAARLIERLLDRRGVDRAVLCHDEVRFTPAQQNTHLAREIARATNDWTIEHWLRRDPRLYGVILVPNQVDDEAVAEIARVGDEPGMVGVLMAVNGLSKPFGHPAYHPIYAAAAERGLPIVIHAGCDAPSETLSAHTAGGTPSLYAEYRAFGAQSLMTHIVSMIVQGVFERYRELQVLVMGGGVSWLPSLLWRFDAEYVAYRREAPWVRRAPSDYVRDHVRIGTWRPAPPAEPDRLVRVLQTIDGVEDLLVHGSGYPDWDTTWPSDLDILPADWRSKVLGDNALKLFRWDAQTPAPALAVAAGPVGDMQDDNRDTEDGA